MNGFRLYREVIKNPFRPEMEGKLFYVQDYGDLDPERWWREDCICVVQAECWEAEEFYGSYGVQCKHWIAAFKAWTCEWIEVTHDKLCSRHPQVYKYFPESLLTALRNRFPGG